MSTLKGFTGQPCFAPQEAWAVFAHAMPQLRVKGSMTEEQAKQQYRLVHGIKDDVPLIVKRIPINGFIPIDRQPAATVPAASAAVHGKPESTQGAAAVGGGS